MERQRGTFHMTYDKQARIPGMGRRLAAAASIVALSLGTLALAGCDDELPASTQQEAPMEEPAQDPAMADPMDSQEPMPDQGAMPDDQEPMPDEGTAPDEQEPMPDEGTAPDEEEPGGY